MSFHILRWRRCRAVTEVDKGLPACNSDEHYGYINRSDGVGKAQVHAAFARPHAQSLVAHFLRRPRGDVARSQVAVAGILAFEEVIALRFRDLARRPGII